MVLLVLLVLLVLVLVLLVLVLVAAASLHGPVELLVVSAVGSAEVEAS